jgi:hypothetical protein
MEDRACRDTLLTETTQKDAAATRSSRVSFAFSSYEYIPVTSPPNLPVHRDRLVPLDQSPHLLTRIRTSTVNPNTVKASTSAVTPSRVSSILSLLYGAMISISISTGAFLAVATCS